MAKDTAKTTNVVYFPINDSQRVVKLRWDNSKLLILRGPAGTGKSNCAVGQALVDIANKRSKLVMLARPTVSCEEDLGFLPGDLSEKLGAWMGAFRDVLGDITTAKLEDFPVELVGVGMLRGRTVKNATLIVDEAQNLTYSQLKCIVTRVGKGGRVVLCGDSTQSDLRCNYSPLDDISKKLMNVEGACVINFSEKDQVREPFVNAVIEALGD